jgi:hypothetical protein
MKKIVTHLIFLFCLLSIAQSYAQDRYVDEIFTDVQVTSGVTYGVNATVLLVPIVGEAVPQELKLDIYEPVGDTETERPLVLVFHTGNFLPPVTNAQIAGSKTDSSDVEICKQLARRGFVAAAVNYRLGWNPLAETQPERALGLIQAAYRGVQDGRTAIRYFKKTVAEDSNPYGIDDSKITMWGNGTGGYLVLGVNGLSFYNEIPLASNPTGKFLLDTNMDGTPETPMVVEVYHGDIEGKVLAVTPDDAFGLPAGDTTNYPNHVAYSSDFQLTVNIGGALGDISWLDDQTVPILTVQSIDDQFAPYNDAILIVPTTGDPIVQVQGLQKIGATQEASAINQGWKDFGFDDAVTQEAQANAATAGHAYYEGSYSWKSPDNSAGEDEGIVINWWDPAGATPATSPCMGLAWNQCPHPSDPSGGTSFHANGLILNEGMSAAKARGNIAKIMDYVIPRACITLDLSCNGVTGTNEPLLDAALVELMPNPTGGALTINTANAELIENVAVFNIEGKLIAVDKNINQTQHNLNLYGQAPGMYIVKIFLADGVVAKKVMLK